MLAFLTVFQACKPVQNCAARLRAVTLTIECDATIEWVKANADAIATAHTGREYVALAVSDTPPQFDGA